MEEVSRRFTPLQPIKMLGYSLMDRGLPGELGGTVKERRAGRFYSPASETLNATEATIKMLIASRRLHLATIHDPKQHSEKRKVIRDALLAATREQVNIAVHLGSMGQLNKCDACEWSQNG